MDILSFFTNALTIFGLVMLLALLIVMALLSRRKGLTRDSRQIFLIMFILASLFVVITFFGK